MFTSRLRKCTSVIKVIQITFTLNAQTEHNNILWNLEIHLIVHVRYLRKHEARESRGT